MHFENWNMHCVNHPYWRYPIQARHLLYRRTPQNSPLGQQLNKIATPLPICRIAWQRQRQDRRLVINNYLDSWLLCESEVYIFENVHLFFGKIMSQSTTFRRSQLWQADKIDGWTNYNPTNIQLNIFQEDSTSYLMPSAAGTILHWKRFRSQIQSSFKQLQNFMTSMAWKER